MFYNPPLPLLIRRSGPVHCCWREMGLSDITASSQGTRKWAGGKKGGGGGDWRKRKAESCVRTPVPRNTCSSLEFQAKPYFPFLTQTWKKLANYHKILYSNRTQLNYLGGRKVKQNRSESVFNCRWYAEQKQVAWLNHLRASTAQGGAPLKNNNTL